MEAMDIGAVDARRDPGRRRELSSMSMTAKLKRNSRFLGDGQPMRRMHEQDARPLGHDRRVAQDRPKLPGIDGFAVMQSDDLQALELDFSLFITRTPAFETASRYFARLVNSS